MGKRSKGYVIIWRFISWLPYRPGRIRNRPIPLAVLLTPFPVYLVTLSDLETGMEGKIILVMVIRDLVQFPGSTLLRSATVLQSDTFNSNSVGLANLF